METKIKFEPNEKQKQAIETIDGTIMVLAGPGTGKTFTIIERIKHMIKEKINPSRILCMTFSEAAASEMKTRLEKEIGEASYGVQISTFHSFCSEIIRKNPAKFNLKEDFDVIDDIRAHDIMNEVVSEYKPEHNKTKLGDIFGDIPSLIKKVGKVKKSLVSKEEYMRILSEGFAWNQEISRLEDKKEFAKSKNRGTKGVEGEIDALKTKIEKAKEFWDIYELYNEKIHQNNLIDFDDMITFILNQFNADSEFQREIASQWDYIFVDEYQDTNKAQNNLIFALEEGRGLGNLFVVGDDDQLIYAFQGADNDTLENFLEKYPKTEIICLNENNRSTQTILDYSYNVISQDSMRLENNKNFSSKNISKKLVAKNQAIIARDRKIKKHQFKDIIQENNFITDEIVKLINSPDFPCTDEGAKDLSQIAILAPTNSDLEGFAQLLKQKGIQYQIREKKNIFKIKSVILTYFYLKALENNRLYKDKLFGVLLSAPFSFNEDDFGFLVSKTNIYNKKDFITIMKENLDYNWAEPEKIKNFISTYDELKKFKNGLSLKGIIIEILNKTGILPYFASSFINRYDNIMGLKKLIEQAEMFSKYQKTYSVTDFVKYLDMAYNNEIAILTDEDIFTKNAIQLSTIHSSKGKEYAYVFMPYLISSKWESSRQGGSDDFSLPIKDYKNRYADLEDLKHCMKRTENLKKLFVAITRAKYGLYLSFSDMNGKRVQKMTEYLSSVERPDLVDVISHSIDTEVYVDEVIKNLTQENISTDIIKRRELETRLEGFVLSATPMNTYLKCPLQFMFSHVLRIPTSDTDITAAQYGNAFHATLEWIYKGNEKYPSLEEIKARFKTELNSREFSSYEVRINKEESGLSALEKFYPELIKTPFENVIETEVNIETNFDGYKIKGKIDRVEKNADGSYTICDYKTGNGDDKKSKIKPGGDYEHYYNQLLFYKLLYELEYPQRKVSEVKILYPETLTVIQFYFNDEEMDSIKQKIHEVYENIQDLYFEKSDNKCQKTCKYCNYKQMCELF